MSTTSLSSCSVVYMQALSREMDGRSREPGGLSYNNRYCQTEILHKNYIINIISAL